MECNMQWCITNCDNIFSIQHIKIKHNDEPTPIIIKSSDKKKTNSYLDFVA